MTELAAFSDSYAEARKKFVDAARREQLGRAAKWVLAGGFGVHCLTLGARWLATGLTPAASLYEALSFFAWALVGTYLLFDLRYRIAVLGGVDMDLLGRGSPEQVRVRTRQILEVCAARGTGCGGAIRCDEEALHGEDGARARAIVHQ